MVDRNQLFGFASTTNSVAVNAFLADVWEANRLAVEALRRTSALTHSCAFLFVSRGVVSEGEPGCSSRRSRPRTLRRSGTPASGA